MYNPNDNRVHYNIIINSYRVISITTCTILLHIEVNPVPSVTQVASQVPDRTDCVWLYIVGDVHGLTTQLYISFFG